MSDKMDITDIRKNKMNYTVYKNNICPNCGKPYFIEGTAVNPDLCKCGSYTAFPPLQGWVCPVCGRGNSPYNLTCPCVNYENFLKKY